MRQSRGIITLDSYRLPSSFDFGLRQIRPLPANWHASLFLARFSRVLGRAAMFPGQAMYQTWLRLLPGFTWFTWRSFALGLVESFAYGWYVAVVFCPLFNFFAARFE